MPLNPIELQLLSTKRGLRNSLSLHKFCPSQEISVKQGQITNTKVGMGAVMAFVLG